MAMRREMKIKQQITLKQNEVLKEVLTLKCSPRKMVAKSKAFPQKDNHSAMAMSATLG